MSVLLCLFRDSNPRALAYRSPSRRATLSYQSPVTRPRRVLQRVPRAMCQPTARLPRVRPLPLPPCQRRKAFWVPGSAGRGDGSRQFSSRYGRGASLSLRGPTLGLIKIAAFRSRLARGAVRWRPLLTAQAKRGAGRRLGRELRERQERKDNKRRSFAKTSKQEIRKERPGSLAFQLIFDAHEVENASHVAELWMSFACLPATDG